MINTVIFDMDGVISDTQKLHSMVESELLGRFGINLTPKEITQQYAGTKTEEFLEELLGDKFADIPSLLKEKWERMSSAASEGVDSIPGAMALINDLADNDFKLGVASASSPEYVKTVLSTLNVIDKFGAITTAYEVEKGKPDPAVFLLAAKKLESNPSECLVIEDGVSGMIGAKRAGMVCVGLVETPDDIDGPADIIVNSLTELTIDKIRNFP